MICSPPGDKLDLGHAGGTKQPGAGRAGPPKNFFVENRSIQLIRREPNLVTPAEFACLIEGFDFLVGKPKSHPLFYQVRFVQMLRHTQDPPEKKGAHFHRRFAHPSREMGRFFDN